MSSGAVISASVLDQCYQHLRDEFGGISCFIRMLRVISRTYSTQKMDYSKFTTKIVERRKQNFIRMLTGIYANVAKEDTIFLAGGMPTSSKFPFKEIKVTSIDGTEQNIIGEELVTALQYGASQGYPPLVKKWRELQQRWHAPPRDDWDLLFTTGSQEGVSKVSELLVEKGDPVMIQKPHYPGMTAAMIPLEPDFIGIEEDTDGIIPEQIEAACEQRLRDSRPLPKLLYVNPTGANPTGTVLSEKRRRKVYDLARKYDFLIIEDDAYCFLHFMDKQPTSLLSMDTDGRVIRLDSFSKIMSPGLRLGVVTANKELLQKLKIHVENSTLHTSFLSQVLVFKMLESWGPERCERHFMELQAYYREKRDIMLASVEKHLTGLAVWTIPKGGMFVWVKVTVIDDALSMVMDGCIPNGVFVLPGNAFNQDVNVPDQHLRLCYSHASPEEIDKGLSIVAKMIREEAAKKNNLRL